MKKMIIGLVLLSTALASQAYAHHKNDVALVAGLGGLALIVGDGRKSFGIHYDRRGFYDFRGQRFRSRANYIRAVKRFERQKFLAQQRRIKERALVNNFSKQRNFNSSRGFSSRNSFSSQRFNSGRYCE